MSRMLWNLTFRHFFSQEPLTYHYPEPHEILPHPSYFFLRSILILCSQKRLGVPSGLFPSGVPSEPLRPTHGTGPKPFYPP